MFERYTERARRTIFFARYEASQFGTPYIEAEFLLLALFREDKLLMQRLLPSNAAEQIRREVERNTVQGLKLSTSVDVPLSNACKRVLAYAMEEAESLYQQHIGNEHLLLGLLREEQSLSARLLLREGLTTAKVRESVTPEQGAVPPRNVGIGSGSARMNFSVPLTTIRVSDVPRSAAFYAALGFALTHTLHSGQIALLQSGPFQLALVHEFLATDLLCFAVRDLSVVDLQLQKAGHRVEEPLTTAANGTDSVLVRDPDGHLILLVSIRSPGRNS